MLLGTVSEVELPIGSVHTHTALCLTSCLRLSGGEGSTELGQCQSSSQVLSCQVLCPSFQVVVGAGGCPWEHQSKA